MTNETKANGTLRVLKENWFIIIAIASIIASWVTVNNRVDNTEEAFEAHRSSFAKTVEIVQESRSEIREIKRDLEYLTKGIDRNEALQHQILTELRK